MKPARVLSVLLVLVVVGALLVGHQSGLAFRSEPGVDLAPASADEGFTYQGRLLVGGTPVSGLYDFKFDLYTLASGGTHLAGPLEKLGVQVTNGTFTVLVDFLAANFNGDTRWLEINVRPAGGSVYTLLTPRQELTPAPYADFAFQVPWSGIQGLQQAPERD